MRQELVKQGSVPRRRCGGSGKERRSPGGMGESFWIPLLADGRLAETPTGISAFPCSSGGGLAATKHTLGDWPSLVALALPFVHPLLLARSLCHLPHPCVCVSFLRFSAPLAVISHVAILSSFVHYLPCSASRRSVVLFPQHLSSLSCLVHLTRFFFLPRPCRIAHNTVVQAFKQRCISNALDGIDSDNLWRHDSDTWHSESE